MKKEPTTKEKSLLFLRLKGEKEKYQIIIMG